MTGATGVVGRRLVPLLRARGDDVTAVVRSPTKAAALVRAGARPIAVDVFDGKAVRDAMLDHDAVINLATHMPRSIGRMMLPGAWRENDRLRRVASARLVDAALVLDIPRFIQESFAPVYPDRGEAWIDEDEPIAPVRHARTVADAEHAVTRFIADGRDGVVLRFAEFYGPDSRLLADMIRMIERGWSPLVGPADAFISSVSHDDAATAAFAALDLAAGTYNVADDEPLRHLAYVDSLADALGVPHPRMLPAWFAGLAGSLGRMLARSQRISNAKLR
ncbi:MAG TPA: NAD-dependent epimerase/dehydratase family protein, partial [Kofleriaceae bacterium]|nr:NAD-dependent epimerase/dehydratase family protein [Kofleriaceae bacterium]